MLLGFAAPCAAGKQCLLRQQPPRSPTVTGQNAPRVRAPLRMRCFQTSRPPGGIWNRPSCRGALCTVGRPPKRSTGAAPGSATPTTRCPACHLDLPRLHPERRPQLQGRRAERTPQASAGPGLKRLRPPDSACGSAGNHVLPRDLV